MHKETGRKMDRYILSLPGSYIPLCSDDTSICWQCKVDMAFVIWTRGGKAKMQVTL